MIMENYMRRTGSQGVLKNKEKVKQIEQKLKIISQNQTGNNRNEWMTDLINRGSQIDGKVNSFIIQADADMREVKESFKQFSRKAQEKIEKSNFLLKNRSREISELDRKVQQLLTKESQKAKEAQRRITIAFEEKIQIISDQLLREVMKRKNYLKQLDESLSQNLPELQNTVKRQLEESTFRIKKLEEILNQHSEDLHREIEEARNCQESAFQNFMKMMSSVIAQIKEEISNEKDNRIASKIKLMNLFENAYSKLSPIYEFI